ncbi:hypothetical protein M8C21_024676 [Ambrosia artemisiifolia]|uniref:Uncharacterized protein n=1 Tax=Ambrosia artemisiifolia TaxID=4212 RepID=A0AAD5G5B0_AMBAR|nr:hypothetical protein M8C21_024676 [Ambrosia artemisiifolia]
MIDVLYSGSNYKADNGFKPGFSNAVEKQLAISLPEAGIKAKPHIDNDMLDAPPPVWKAYAQVHKHAGRWRSKKFPHYWELCNLFGKDLANGRDAQTAGDILSDLNREEQEVTGDGLDDIDVNQTLNNPLHADSREESSTQRKRKRRNSFDSLMNSLKESAEIIGAEIRGASNTFDKFFWNRER